jgi:asparagine synthase (glutamine-hydrolysing)
MESEVTAFFSAYEGLAGILDSNRIFDQLSAHVAVGGAFGPDAAPEVVAAGSLAVARVRGRLVRPSREGTVCLFVGRINTLDRASGQLNQGELTEEAIAAAYDAQGSAVLENLCGSFVLVLWNETRRHGLVAQDQLGSRSLYYWRSGSRLLFASDVFPILKLLPRRPSPERVAVVHMLAGGTAPLELTQYEGIKRATGAHVLELVDGRVERRRYWAPRYVHPPRRSRVETSEELWSAVSDAVRVPLRNAEPVGLIMSGGLDSAIVAAATAKSAAESRDQLRAYSAVFPALPRCDESPRIRLLAEHLDLGGAEIEPCPRGLVAVSLEYLKRWDVPNTGSGLVLEHPLVERAAGDGVRVLLDGQGGNEVFSLPYYLPADRLRHGRVISSIRLARAFPLALYPAPWKQTYAIWKLFAFKAAFPGSIHAAIRRSRGFEHYTQKHLTPEAAKLFFDGHAPWAWRKSDGPLWWAFKVDLMTQGWEKTRLTEYLRQRAAARGMEALSPLMDLRLVELALTIPPEMEFDARHDRPLVREALHRRVPDQVRLWREKSNLAPFYHHCAIEDLPAYRRILLAADAEVRAFVKPEVVEKLLADPPRVGDRAWAMWLPRVWSLFQVETFLRHQSDPTYVDRLQESRDVRRPAGKLHRARL